MKFSTTILRITPFSAVCSMATALAAVFLPSDFERLALSSVAGDAEEGARRFDALASLLLGAADSAARGIRCLHSVGRGVARAAVSAGWLVATDSKARKWRPKGNSKEVNKQLAQIHMCTCSERQPTSRETQMLGKPSTKHTCAARLAATSLLVYTAISRGRREHAPPREPPPAAALSRSCPWSQQCRRTRR